MFGSLFVKLSHYVGIKVNLLFKGKYNWLAFIILLATGVRVIQLGGKNLWIDEIITAIFTFGIGYQGIPTEELIPLDQISLLFQYQNQSCSEIANALAQKSSHPPLFFCLMHSWLGFLQQLSFLDISLAIQLRLLPVILGIIAIFALYHLNQASFSQRAGLVGATLMAVSPFTVYLSQEARQYTLGLTLVTIALLALIKILKQGGFISWLLWGMTNSIGIYTHYFFLLSFFAQIITLLVFFYPFPKRIITLGGVIIGVSLSYLPWLPTVIDHFSSATTDWLPEFDWFSPIYQLLLGGLVMVVTFPVEKQPLPVQILSGIFMLGFAGWLIYRFRVGYQQLQNDSDTKKVTLALSLYLIILLVQFVLVIYLLQRNIAIAPRYNYIFYPAICALLGASLSFPQQRKALLTVISVGLISSLFVVFNFFFIKPYQPELTAERFNRHSESTLVIMTYKNQAELALGLSYGLALDRISAQSSDSALILLDREEGYNQVWQKISQLAIKIENTWLIAPGLREKDFPNHLNLAQEQNCQRDRAEYYRIGFPYQRYQCQENLKES
ncbi:MAG: glycosyltransferase family 39 protein [Halothece sp.]